LRGHSDPSGARGAEHAAATPYRNGFEVSRGVLAHRRPAAPECRWAHRHPSAIVLPVMPCQSLGMTLTGILAGIAWNPRHTSPARAECRPGAERTSRSPEAGSPSAGTRPPEGARWDGSSGARVRAEKGLVRAECGLSAAFVPRVRPPVRARLRRARARGSDADSAGQVRRHGRTSSSKAGAICAPRLRKSSASFGRGYHRGFTKELPLSCTGAGGARPGGGLAGRGGGAGFIRFPTGR